LKVAEIRVDPRSVKLSEIRVDPRFVKIFVSAKIRVS
jgi:hypothetical protein